MNQQVLFKTSTFGGFEKKAVLDYILKLNESAEEVQQELAEHLREVTQAKEDLDLNLREAQDQIHIMQEDLQRKTGELTEVKSRAERLTKQVETLDQDLTLHKNLLAEAQTKAEHFARVNEELQERTVNLEAHRGDVEKASTQIGRLLIEAHSDADRILAEANDEARKVLDEAKQEARGAVDEAREKAELSVVDAKRQAAEMMDTAAQAMDAAYQQIARLREDMSSMQQTLLDAVQAMQGRMGDMGSVLDAAETQIQSLRSPSGTPEDTAVLEEAPAGPEAVLSVAPETPEPEENNPEADSFVPELAVPEEPDREPTWQEMDSIQEALIEKDTAEVLDNFFRYAAGN